MGTVQKALSLLDYFAVASPELSLAALAQKSGFDKATTRRLLLAMASHGLVEQDAASRRYRLGPALVRLAHLRQAAFPYVTAARPIADELAVVSGETVHVSELASGVLSTVYIAESARAHRVAVAVGQQLPLNCTASGIAVLAFGGDSLLHATLTSPLVAFTGRSLTTPAALRRAVAKARQDG